VGSEASGVKTTETQRAPSNRESTPFGFAQGRLQRRMAGFNRSDVAVERISSAGDL